jgi:hypothetical protein
MHFMTQAENVPGPLHFPGVAENYGCETCENYSCYNVTISVPSWELKTCEIFGMSIAFCFKQLKTGDTVFHAVTALPLENLAGLMMGYTCKISKYKLLITYPQEVLHAVEKV